MSDTTAKPFVAGNDYFTDDGERVYLVGAMVNTMNASGPPYSYVVNRYVVIDNGYGDDAPIEVIAEFPHFVHRLHHVAPAKKASPVVAALDEEIAALKEKRDELSHDLHDMKLEMQDARSDLATYPDFGLAMDFLEGRITHFVVQDYGVPKIKLAEDAVAPEHSYGRVQSAPIRLISLTGHYDAKGKRVTKWGVNRYSSGTSHNDTHFYPCRGLEEAQAKVRELFAEAYAVWKSKAPEKDGLRWGYWTMKEWESCGVDLEWPADLVNEIQRGTFASAHAARVRAQEEAAKAANLPTTWWPPKSVGTDIASIAEERLS